VLPRTIKAFPFFTKAAIDNSVENSENKTKQKSLESNNAKAIKKA
jgi:hypothetical protein